MEQEITVTAENNEGVDLGIPLSKKVHPDQSNLHQLSQSIALTSDGNYDGTDKAENNDHVERLPSTGNSSMETILSRALPAMRLPMMFLTWL